MNTNVKQKLFGDELKNDDIYYRRAEDGNLVVAQDEDGNDIKMNSSNIVSNENDPRPRRLVTALNLEIEHGKKCNQTPISLKN